tara:strand:+ start:212 stop:916 length:705 start_codon:yes stop_codon:yes gene_type:complete
MSVTKKLKWKRSLSRLRYCYDELEYTKEAARSAAADFEVYYRTFCAERNINISNLDTKNKERLDSLYGRHEITDDNTQEQASINSPTDTTIVVHSPDPLEENESYKFTADDIAMHDAFSKLFKQIALKLHPDRVDKSLSPEEIKLRINMFQKANQAFENKKYYILLDLADKYNIRTPKNYELQSRWMTRECERVVEMVNKEKNTYNYSFSEAETDEQKQFLIKKFIFQLFRIVV